MAEAPNLPTVAIIGRPNVGKSSLFNRLVGGRRAIVDDRPGVTRDRQVASADWLGRDFQLVDTGGFDAQPGEGLTGRVRDQSLRAVADADVVVFVVDGRAGIAPADEEAARLLERTGKPIVCAANKIDTPKQATLPFEFYRLGLGDPVAVSAEHGRGIDDLLDRISALLPEAGAGGSTRPTLRLALLGRPNAGKSSLLNRLVGDERVLVDAEPGTTRDSIDTRVEVDGESVLLVDTAGVRRRSRIDESLERVSVSRAFQAVERAEIALLVIDAAEGVTDQDARLASLVWDRGRGLLLVANKWDLLARESQGREAFSTELRRRFAHFEHVPVVFTSARIGTGLGSIVPAARRVADAWRSRIPTRRLNQVLEEASRATEPPIVRGKRARFFYATSLGSGPPRIVLFVNDPATVTTSYLRYLDRRIRKAFPLEGTPLRIELRERTNRRGRISPPRGERRQSPARPR